MRHITRLDRENNETLYAYAEFLGEPTDYVLNQLIDAVLAKDKDFVAWRTEHPDSYVPAPASQPKRGKRSEPHEDRVRSARSTRAAVPASAGA